MKHLLSLAAGALAVLVVLVSVNINKLDCERQLAEFRQLVEENAAHVEALRELTTRRSHLSFPVLRK